MGKTNRRQPKDGEFKHLKSQKKNQKKKKRASKSQLSIYIGLSNRGSNESNAS